MRVKDTGIGIDETKRVNLFNAFKQVDSSTTREFGGSGLGLAIVKNLCERMNGSVSVQSTPNKGSEFTATVQLDIAPEATPLPGLNGTRVLAIINNPKSNP